MSIERTPTGEALFCMHCNRPGPGLDIDHVQNRGSGGSKERDVPENKVPLCRPCHELKTMGQVETRVKDTDSWGTLYQWRFKHRRVWVSIPVHVDKRHGCLETT